MHAHVAAPTGSLGRSRFGVSLMFFSNGVLFSALLPRYPEFKAAFGLSNTEFGVLVIAFPVGALVAAGFAGRVIRGLGTLRTSRAGSLVLAAAMAVAGASHHLWLFAAALAVAGAVDSMVDSAQNVQGVLVETWGRRSMINSFHAVWSVGAASGGAIGAAAAAAGISPGTQMLANSAVWALVAVVACHLAKVSTDAFVEGTGAVDIAADGREAGGGLAAEVTEPTGHEATPRWRAWLLLPFVVLAICGTLVEDIANNWTVLYLGDVAGAPAAVAGLGVTAVLVAQFVGRLLGDPMTDRWGRADVARTGGFLIAAGALIVVLSPAYPLTFAGFALMGIGCATLVPAAFAAAGRIPGLRSESGISMLGWLMRLGFLLTSPAVGRLSDLTSLRTAMLIPAAAGLIAAFISHKQRPTVPVPAEAQLVTRSL